MTRDELDELINAIVIMRSAADDDTAAQCTFIYQSWKPGTDYAADTRVKDIGKLWKCITAHTSQEGWRPSDTPALWVEVAKPGEYREIKDAMLPTEAFALGEIGWYGDKSHLYKSLINVNVYTPVTYPAGWEAL